MNTLRFLFMSLAIVVSLFLFETISQGQTIRTWVSGVGDDTAPCSRTAPCKTFAGAIARTLPSGQINVLDSGAYGTLIIAKSITIDASGLFAGVKVPANGNGFVINAGANDVVVLRHLTIDGGGEGRSAIKFNTGKSVYLEDSRVHGFLNYAVDFQPSAGGTLGIRNCYIVNNGNNPVGLSGGGVLLKAGTGNAFASIESSTIGGNYIGINAKDNSRITLSNSVLSRNGTALLTMPDSTGAAEMNVESATVTLNTVGIRSGGCVDRGFPRPTVGASTVRISNVNVTGNSSYGLVSGCRLPELGNPSFIVSSGNNSILGNGTDGAPTSTIPQR